MTEGSRMSFSSPLFKKESLSGVMTLIRRKRRTEILIRGDRRLAARLAEQVQRVYAVQSVEDADHGLVMIKMRETAQNTRFYIGELFVTEAKVKINEHIGIGIIQGDEPELAYQLAVIDAAYVAQLPETREWTVELEAEEERIRERQIAEHRKRLLSKVQFETMQEEEQT